MHTAPDLTLRDLPDSVAIWKDGMKSEVEFWDSYFSTKGLEWSEYYEMRFDPELVLQDRPAKLLPPRTDVYILDVGAGPLTFLGKKLEGRNISITAVDPLADEYDKLTEKYGVHPPVRTLKLAAEELSVMFPPSCFDLVVARNCIDHSYNPEKAILQLIRVVKQDCFVLLEHRENEAVNANYLGLHQWNFSLSPEGDFLISSKTETLNMTKKYSNICRVECEVIEEPDDGEWLITRIRKF
ncbi:MAG: class I SAM-dependent methyltransferase [Ignavibacteria bacterium]|nr:class I SAM-dependent methyltransferase [Ignavibacteria bacterium]